MNVIKTKILMWLSMELLFAVPGHAQRTDEPAKVHHAEPLYFDLVRDLGARKGERELNLAAGLTNSGNYNRQVVMAEYEFAPVHRLGVEVEADVAFFKRTGAGNEVPANALEELRFSTQYSFFVSPEHKTTMAVGYTQILGNMELKPTDKKSGFSEMTFSPFFVAAKRWGRNVHSLLYGCSFLDYDFDKQTTRVRGQLTTSFLYTLPQTGHFIGVELNHETDGEHVNTTLYPQVKIRCNHRLAVGLVTGIPLHGKSEGCSSFFRIIYEP